MRKVQPHNECWGCGWMIGHRGFPYCGDQCWLNDGAPSYESVIKIRIFDTIFKLGLTCY